MSFADRINPTQIKVIANLTLITAASYFGVSFFYQMAGMRMQTATPHTELAAASADASATPRQHQPLSQYAAILERDLFNTAKAGDPKPVEPPPMDVDDLEVTDLHLKLWGTVSGAPEKAYAVIEDTQKREQNLYRVGDTIQDAVVKMVMREKVILNRNGKDEMLGMEEIAQAGPASRRGQIGLGSRRGAMQPTPVRGPREQRITVQRSTINEAMQDMSNLMTQVAIRPHMENGEANGLAVSRIKPNSIFRRLGLRNGDILVGLNGREIRTVDDALSLYENLLSADDMALQIKRRGQERTINYNIR
ncbi:MAG: type II secretion system protein GspC [Desulfatitalea sp.]|nr:type II secretion system protein GspC [Desulfatitalea sp.]NNK01420.1 type II secretion system protein GspC [Desulfatitalea sp.]